MKPRKPIRRRSKRMAKLMRQYNKQREVFLKLHPHCLVCVSNQDDLPIQPATEVHHRKGRGLFLLDESTWVPVCAVCHRFVHDHPSWSYANGWMERRNVLATKQVDELPH